MNESNFNQGLESLRQENAELRDKLTRAHAMTRELLNEVFPYVRATEGEIQALMQPAQGESIQVVLAGYRDELAR